MEMRLQPTLYSIQPSPFIQSWTIITQLVMIIFDGTALQTLQMRATRLHQILLRSLEMVCHTVVFKKKKLYLCMDVCIYLCIHFSNLTEYEKRFRGLVDAE